MPVVKEIAISELNKAMFRVCQLTSFLEHNTHLCHITILNELGLDLGSLNASHQLNAYTDISCLCLRVNKNTSKDGTVLSTIDAVPTVEFQIVSDLAGKIVYIYFSLGIRGGLWSHLGSLVLGGLAHFGVAVGASMSSPVSSLASSSLSWPASSDSKDSSSLGALHLPVRPWSFR